MKGVSSFLSPPTSILVQVKYTLSLFYMVPFSFIFIHRCDNFNCYQFEWPLSKWSPCGEDGKKATEKGANVREPVWIRCKEMEAVLFFWKEEEWINCELGFSGKEMSLHRWSISLEDNGKNGFLPTYPESGCSVVVVPWSATERWILGCPALLGRNIHNDLLSHQSDLASLLSDTWWKGAAELLTDDHLVINWIVCWVEAFEQTTVQTSDLQIWEGQYNLTLQKSEHPQRDTGDEETRVRKNGL